MITSNTSIPFIKAENSENKFYLSRLTSEYNEGDSITTSTAINCRKLAIAIKAGDKITINGTSLTVYADAAVDATSFFVEEITLDEALNINANIAIDEDNMFVQYQRKTEGTVAGFDIDADGMSKGGVEITGWLDSDTMEGATENNIPTAQSVKAYVDASSGGTTPTLQEVTDAGNTTTNSVSINSGTNSLPGLSFDSDSNTGVFRSSENVIGLSAGGLKVLYDGIILHDDTLGGFLLKRVGTSANPTFSFGGSYNGNGMFRPSGLNAVGFSTAGSEKMRITNTGLVGIGTSSPDQMLHISGLFPRIKLQDTDAANTLDHSLIEQNDGVLRFRNDPSYLSNNSAIQFDIRGSEKMRLTSTGLGIGTSSPAHPLQVEGGAWPSKAAVFSDGYYAYNFGFGSKNSGVASADINFWTISNTFHIDNGTGRAILFDQGGIERMRIDTGGNVLIGTTTDDGYKLDVQDTSATYVARFRGSSSTYVQSGESTLSGETGFLAKNSTGALYLGVAGGVAYFTGTSGANTMKFGVGGAEKMRITSDGNVLIGSTANNGGKLQVEGDIRLSNSAKIFLWQSHSANYLQYYRWEASTGNLMYINNNGSGGVGIKTGSTERMRITTLGNLLIGTTTNSTVGGTAKMTINVGSGTSKPISIVNGTTDGMYIRRFGSSGKYQLQTTVGSGNSGALSLQSYAGNVLIGTTTDDGYQLDVNGTQRVQDVLELDDVLTLNAISTPDDPDEGKSSIYMDSADGAIKVKINFEGEVVTRTIASFDG